MRKIIITLCFLAAGILVLVLKGNDVLSETAADVLMLVLIVLATLVGLAGSLGSNSKNSSTKQ